MHIFYIISIINSEMTFYDDKHQFYRQLHNSEGFFVMFLYNLLIKILQIFRKNLNKECCIIFLVATTLYSGVVCVSVCIFINKTKCQTYRELKIDS